MKTNQITFEEANELLRYDENTGLLFWKNVTGNKPKGAAGWNHGDGSAPWIQSA